jgi:hypothetical protein
MVLVGSAERKRPLGIHRRRWEDNIKRELTGGGRGGLDWISLAEDREQWKALVNTVMNRGFHNMLKNS